MQHHIPYSYEPDNRTSHQPATMVVERSPASWGLCFRRYQLSMVLVLFCLFNVYRESILPSVYREIISAKFVISSVGNGDEELKTSIKGEGSFHKPNSFEFDNQKMLDAFVAPPLRADSGVFVIMVGFSLKNKAPAAACLFGDNHTSPLQVAAGEAYRCQVPLPVLEQIQNATAEDDFLALTLQKTNGTELVYVAAALWPWRNQHFRYEVAVNNMNKNVECGVGNEHCFSDWVLWHRNMGVQHFFIYDNLSDKDHPWLRAAQTFLDQGILTLIDWPYFLGGPDNNMAQRVSMNHAMFAVASRVKWLGCR